MEKKSNRGVVISLLVVIVVLIGSITYMLFSGVLTFNTEKKETNKTEEKENKNEETDKEDVESNSGEDKESVPEEIDITKYQSINDFVMMGSSSSGAGAGLYGDLKIKLLTNDVTNKSLDDYNKLVMTMGVYGTKNFNIVSNDGTTSVSSLNGNIVLERINELFGKDNGYKHIAADPARACKYYKYNLNDNVYEFYDSNSCGDETVYKAYDKVVKTIKTSDSIVVTVKFYFRLGNAGVYKDLNGAQKIDGVYDQNKSDYYFEQGATVTYTFKLAEGGSYYFDNSKITY